jgi:hypothetical protein
MTMDFDGRNPKEGHLLDLMVVLVELLVGSHFRFPLVSLLP